MLNVVLTPSRSRGVQSCTVGPRGEALGQCGLGASARVLWRRGVGQGANQGQTQEQGPQEPLNLPGWGWW